MPRSETALPPAGMRFSGCTGCGIGTDGFDGAGCAAIGEAIATAAATVMLTKIGFIVTLPGYSFSVFARFLAMFHPI